MTEEAVGKPNYPEWLERNRHNILSWFGGSGWDRGFSRFSEQDDDGTITRMISISSSSESGFLQEHVNFLDYYAGKVLEEIYYE